MNVQIKIYILIFLSFSGLFQVQGQDIFSVQPVSFNDKRHDDFSPFQVPGGLIFVSNRVDNLVVKRRDLKDEPLNNLYFVPRDEEKEKWKQPVPVGKSINTRYHEGPSSLTADGYTLYFTRNTEVGGGIFSARKTNNDWNQIRPFDHNSSEYNLGHPAISPDGNTLFFVSDKPGGQGGFDLYVSRKANNRWSNPENLGDKVNTPGNELFPFFHANGRLYFSSDGHPGAAGLDIYYTIEVDGTWLEPKVLDFPINSPANDFGYTSDPEDKNGFFSSNRLTGVNIFSFTALLPTFDECIPQRENSYCYTFFERGSINVDTTSFRYQWDLGDGSVSPGLEVDYCYAEPGMYLVQLNVIDTITGEVFFNEASELIEVSDIEQVYITSPDTVKINEPVTMHGHLSNLPGFTPDRYFWEFGDGKREQGPEVVHAYQKPGTYTISLGITGKSLLSLGESKHCGVKTIVVVR